MIVLSVASATAGIRHYCDYLGSTRAVVDTAGMLLQTMNYYPSGVPFSRMEQESVTDRLHTGKPFLDMNGLGYYDNNARFLDILTGSFISRDALASSYPHLSPYANCANNPLIYIDPTGMEPCDPVENPQIKRNRASNLYGKDIRLNRNGKKSSHQGFDYYAPIGTSVKSVKNGTIYNVQSDENLGGAYGKSITIEHIDKDGNKIYTFYAHLSEILVQKGLIVKEGDTIGKTGNSGNASNMLEKDQHLHFELRTQPESKKSLDGKKNPNIIVDTKFESQDPNAEYQNQQGVVKMTLDGKKVNMNIDLK